MPDIDYLSLSGSGDLTTSVPGLASDFTLRVNVTSLGDAIPAGSWTPQPYTKLGWFAPFERIGSADIPPFPGGDYVQPQLWITFQLSEFFCPVPALWGGIWGVKYSFNLGVVADVHLHW